MHRMWQPLQGRVLTACCRTAQAALWRSRQHFRTEMTVMMASAPKVPAKTMPRASFSASSTAMKNVLSPSSEKRIRRNPDTAPSLKGLSPSSPGTPPRVAQALLVCKVFVWQCTTENVVHSTPYIPKVKSDRFEACRSSFTLHCAMHSHMGPPELCVWSLAGSSKHLSAVQRRSLQWAGSLPGMNAEDTSVTGAATARPSAALAAPAQPSAASATSAALFARRRTCKFKVTARVAQMHPATLRTNPVNASDLQYVASCAHCSAVQHAVPSLDSIRAHAFHKAVACRRLSEL